MQHPKPNTKPNKTAIANNPLLLEPLPPVPHNRVDNPPGNKYPDAFRVEIAEEILSTKNLTAVAEKYGLARNTVISIAKEFFGEKRELESIFLSEELHTVANRAIQELKSRNLSKASVSQLGVLVGICLDKAEQLTNKIQSPQNLNLKIAWKDGSGAVELSTGNMSTAGKDK